MPYDIIDLIERDETLATCQVFNAEICYGSGLVYDTCVASEAVKNDIDDFLLDNDLASYFLGVCQYFKHFGFAVSVIILNAEGTKVVQLLHKEACYCRLAPSTRCGIGRFNIAPPIEPSIKTAFKFIADSIPDPRSLFIISGKRYVCEKLTATFTESGMSQLIKGVFYPVTENISRQ